MSMQRTVSWCALALLAGACCALPAFARPVPFRTYEQLTNESDLVVIASPISSRETTERVDLPYVSPRQPAIGVETTFEVATVLKGELRNAPAGKKTLVFHHLRLRKNDQPIPNGPGLVEFEPGSRKQYLMFLRREKDGRYEALTGQTDPDLSIEPLRWQR
jgi:hypothetical protein